jgi:DNA mismatch repair ATPase MutS
MIGSFRQTCQLHLCQTVTSCSHAKRVVKPSLVTTHDLALTQIAELLTPRAANVHFEDQLENGAITFDYHMRPGVVQNSNALALMRSIGLEV